MCQTSPSQRKNNKKTVSVSEDTVAGNPQLNIPPKKIVPKISTILTSAVFSILALLLTVQSTWAICPAGTASITHSTNINDSWAELCSTAANPSTVRLIVYNETPDADLTNLEITETLPPSMTYVPGSATVVAVLKGPPPTINSSGQIGQILTITLNGILEDAQNAGTPNWMYIDFQVYRSDEGLISSTANYTFFAVLSYDTTNEHPSFTPCSDTPNSGNQILPLREPDPGVNKSGWNVDASQTEGQATTTVYGNNNDDVIWRLEFTNSGNAPLEDLIFDDTMVPGNIQVNYVCTSAGAATGVANANGAGPGACYATYKNKLGAIQAVANSITQFAVDDPFGNPPSFIDVPVSGSEVIYLVGKLEPNASCSVTRTNTVENIEWGCEADPFDGGITQTSTGSTAGASASTLNTLANNAGLNINTQITGLNGTQPVGSRGLVTITVTNNTGGSVRDIHFRDVLPPLKYVVDPTFTPVLAVTPAYGAYPGLIDTVVWTNPQAAPLDNKAPEFDLTSNGVSHPNYADQINMLRHGDVAVLTFQIVMIDSTHYDRVADLDVRTENIGDGTDPNNILTLSNDLYVDFVEFCTLGTVNLPVQTTNHQADPEDLDIDIVGPPELIFILTSDPAQRLPLTVNLTNNGGHDADDYYAYVTFGVTMDVVTVPGGCSFINQPLPHSPWELPDKIPANSKVYQCTGGPIGPGQTVALGFEVLKSTIPAEILADDLTFRADVVGEITLSDTTLLDFPTPIVRADGITDPGNNYTIDGLRARVIGFNLLKTQVGNCTENNPPPSSPDLQIQIGEECTYHIETGGWFGFQTPGFTVIAVQNIQVVDESPNGQGYISSTDPYATGTTGPPLTSPVTGISLNPPALASLDEGWFDWTFNTVVPAERITETDRWFRVNVSTRLLNDPIDSSGIPNQHALLSTNVLNSYFDAVFDNSGVPVVYNLGPSIIGYPSVAVRRIDLTVTEPNITVVKEVCNEDLYGIGPTCSNFVSLADDGDAYDSYIYRLTIRNRLSTSGVQHAPAYEVTVTDVLDASDLGYVQPFASDSLDNDNDTVFDEAGTNEGAISDNVVKNGTPAEITFSHTHSSALQRIDPGQSVLLYYRVDYDDDAAPLQIFTNTANATYDSLEGDFGNQSVPPQPNSDIGGARVYTSLADTASVQIIPVLTQPKTIASLSNTIIAGPSPQGVSIGEEIQYRLNTLLPVALLKNFVIRDELPAGMRCIEAPDIDLDAAPYSAAGFDPGGTFTPNCTDTFVEWNFGDQRVTDGTAGNPYNFEIGFIARVDNIAGNNDGDLLSNGEPATQVTARYDDEVNNTIVINIDQVDVQVREPYMTLTKTFAVANSDADDILTVTMTTTNTGTATAYNIRVLDDLTGLNLTYVGNVGGVNPPDTIDTATLGANQPIFSWNPPNGIDVGNGISFTFEVRVDNIVQPHEILDNTIQARWTSLPGQTTALNSSGTIGADGSATGMRIGVLPNNPLDTLNDYETTAADQATVPAVTMTKTDITPALSPTIGVHKNFQIEIQLPEGISNNVLVTDSLDAAGISYVLENNATYDITYIFQGISTINGLVPSEASLTAFPADGITGNAIWDIGTVVTQTEDDSTVNAITPLIRITYYARINNDLVTDDGDTLQNSVVVNYTNGEPPSGQETLTDTTAIVTVVEPLLTVAKSMTNATLGKAAEDPPGGGDLLEYVITIPNTGTSTAFDVNIVDTLPPELLLYSGFTPTATIGGVAVAGFTPTPAGAPDGQLTWGRNNGDTNLDIPAGDTLVLTYQAQVQVSTITTFQNEVYVDWTSLDATSTFERTGAGCPAVIAPNDYCAGPASVISTTVDNNRLTKSVASDSYVDSFSTANDATVRIGDTVTYRLALDFGEGLTQSVQVTDVLPAGMAFENLVGITSASGGTFTYTVTTQPAAGDTGTLTWDFGDIINQPSNDATPVDTLVIEYVAKVLPNAGIIHVSTTTLTNAATLHYLDFSGTPVVDPARLDSQASITVWQPVMSTPTKIDRSGRTSGVIVNVATDVMNFRLQSCNTTGDAPAYSLQMTDDLPTQLDETSIAGPINGPGQPDVTINGAPATAGVDYTYTPPAARGGTMVFFLTTPVNPGQCITIDYDIGFYTDFGPNQSWNNSITVDSYWSLPAQSGQLYGPEGPTTFTMQNVAVNQPPDKAIVSPASGEATIGEEIVYNITIPATVKNAAMYDIAISDDLNSNLVYVSASEISGNSFTLTDNSVNSTEVRLYIDHIPAGQQAVIELRVRLDNTAGANAGVTFTNMANFTNANTPSGAVMGGGSDTSPPILIVEPLLNLAKSAANVTNPGNPPQAGDILRYTLTFTAAGGAAGDNFTDAFDLTIDDSLSLGLAYNGNPTVNGAGNTIAAPVVTGDGDTTPQTLAWSPGNGNADIDIPEGTVVSVTYEVLVLDSVLINQTLTNSAIAQWTGLDGASTFERNGTGTPVENDYFTGPATTTLTVQDTTTITKTRLQDTFNAADANVRIGDIVDYELRLGLQEGTYNAVIINDILPQGLIFEGVVSVNGDTSAPYGAVAPFAHSDIPGTNITAAGDAATGPTTITWNLGDILNTSDANGANDEFVIIYRAKVLNDAHPHVNNIALTNTVQLDYTTATGAALPQTNTETITLLQPNLTVAKSAVAAGGDTVLAADEIVTYTVDITNTGSAPAYDTVLEDIIPVGMRNGATTITMVSTQLLSGPVLPNLLPIFDTITGIATWDFDTGFADAYTIPAGDTLRIVYQVQADSTIGAAMTLTNQAQVKLYYSLDDEAVPTLGGVIGVRQIYGPSNISTTTLTTPAPDALIKQNPAVTTVAVGEPFTYRITVPATPQATSLYDVRIIDDLSASAADLSFVSVTKVFGSQSWDPENTGTAPQIVIEDTSGGIDIPAGEQIIIDITVVLNDSLTNVSGLLFNNTASYTYDRINDDPTTQEPGGPDITPDLTIVGPDVLTLQKSGPATLQLGTPGTFTLDLHNPSSGTAWNPTITDLLPQGGMCGTAPANVTAQIFEADGVTPVSAPLVEGTDFTVSFVGAPTCEWTITLLSVAGGVAFNQRLIVNYDAELDLGTVNGINLTNIAGVTEWFSADSASARTYTEVLTDGTTTILDHEDAHTVATEAPILEFRKTVQNMTTGQNPGSNASPGDTLRYTIQVTNIGPVGLSSFAIIDEVDLLNVPIPPPIEPPLFVPGSLNLITVPVGADTSGTSGTGGVNGTGLVHIDNLVIGAQDDANDSLVVEFEVTLVPVIDSNTVVENQAQIDMGSPVLINSDDPNVNGLDDPTIIGDEDPTETLITSAPAFEILKTSQDLTGDPAVLMAGDSLRYTITVKNIGDENAVNMLLTDQVPANTTYVAGSTTLNGVSIPDEPPSGDPPLQDGMLINAPENTTPGFMRADATATSDNVATITFDVTINIAVLDGTIIANQGFLTGNGAGSGPVPEEPSDDPDTATLDDPTRDVVGNLPLVDAQKTVQIVVDNGSVNILDPGDVIRYTITITNAGAIPATGVVFTDTVPVNTTYVANSVELNGLPVAQPDGGISPLITGTPVSSSDLTPPMPAVGNGTLSPGSTAIITFDVQVNIGVATGTIITNQGIVSTNELPDEPTDADGIDSNGDQPTQIAVGNAQLLSITKDVSVVGGGTAEPDTYLEYVVRVTNIGTLPATNVVVTDDLGPLAGLVLYVGGSGLMNGSTAGVSYAGSVLTADYASQYGDLQPGGVVVVRFRVQIDSAVAIGTTITNTGVVSWNSPAQTVSANVSLDVGGTPGSAILNGNVWHDAGLDLIFDSTELTLGGWSVELYRDNLLLTTVLTDANGAYQISGIVPNQGTTQVYELRFLSPGAGPNTASLGYADSIFTNGPQQISDIIVASGNNLQNLNLPIWPNGTVYNSVVRIPVAGAQLSLLNAASGALLPIQCFDDPSQQDQITTQNGFYKFDLNFSDAACPAGGAYLIEVTSPASGYLAGSSQIIPPSSDASTAPFSVPPCPGSVGDAVPATAGFCEVVASAAIPPVSVLPGTPDTIYHLHLMLSNGTVPGQSQIFNNPIPVDPELNGAVAITKTSSMINVTKGALVPYTITVTNVFGVPLYDISINDRFPAGFKYVPGSARLEGNPTEPLINGLELIWDGLQLQVNAKYTIQLLLVVGSGVSEGEYINRAQVFNTITGTAASGEATATVQVIPDPDFDCTDVIGKVFNDTDRNGRQDKGEEGLTGVRVVTTLGLISTTDEHGRFHITCAAVPDEDRGSNFILKLDERSLPTGFRVTTENPRVQRATRGKMMRFNFGATIHRVVRIDVADGAFETNSKTMRLQWTPKIVQLIDELKKSPSVLRLSYLADVERQSLVRKRLKALKKEIRSQWDRSDGGYQLVVETEVFWRRGAPVKGRK